LSCLCLLLIIFTAGNAKTFHNLNLPRPGSLNLSQEQREAVKLDATALYEQAAKSVVLITAVDASGKKWLGSGVIIRSDGLIATNFHVINGAVSARVQLRNGDIYDEVTILDDDERKDIALVKIKAVNLPTLLLADSDDLKVGNTIFALGAPLGLEGSISQGLVSGIRPAKEISGQLEGFRVIQFTAPISHGNSGGPLLDERGNVVGLVSAYLPKCESGNSSQLRVWTSGRIKGGGAHIGEDA
jgi:S1-C subfamily serine protease